MKHIKKLFLIIMAFLSSCVNGHTLGMYHYTNNPPHSTPIKIIPIVVDKNFGIMDRNSINLAIEQWNYALNGFMILNVEDWEFDMDINEINDIMRRKGYLVFKIDSNSSLIPYAKGNLVIAFCNEIGGNFMYIIRDRLNNDDIKYIALHEFGHLLGSGHVGGRLMNELYYKSIYQCIDYDTIKAVAEYNHLPLQKLNYCSYEH